MSYNQHNPKAEQGIIKHTFNEIRQAILDNNGAVVDDHLRYRDSYAEMIIHPHAIAMFGEHVVLLHSELDEDAYYCLNRMYLDDDGIPHLSKISVGGIINIGQHGTMEKAVEAYNDPASWTPGYNYTKVTNVFYFEREAACV